MLGALQDADPGARRRNLLFAAALLIALAIAAAAAAGAWLPKQDVAPDLSLLPPADPQALPSPSLTAPSAAPTALAFPRTTGVWVSTNSMGTRRLDNTAVRLLDGRVLVVGGADDDTSAELYDPATGTWSSTGSMIKPPEGFKATLLLDGRVLVGDVEGAEVYDPDSGTWTATGSMVATDPVGRQFESATLLRDGRALVVHYGGGTELYDPDTGTWTGTGQLTPPMDIPTPVTLPDGRVLVAGGEGTSNDHDRAALYDPATGTWTATETMGTPRLEHIAVPLLDGRVLVVSGGTNSDWKDTSAELYDPATGTWSATGSMLRPHAGFPATLLDDGRVLAGDTDGAELYDPDSGTWTDAGLFRRPNGSATLLLDGTVLVAGYSAAQLYIPAGVSPPPLVEPDGGVWIATGTMGTPRSGHTAVRLLDGRVLVAGGANGDRTDTSAELYDSATGTWSATGSMLKPLGGWATLLSDGRVLVGDIDDPDADDPISGAEVYDPASGTWTATGKMVNGVSSAITATLLRDGKVLVIGKSDTGEVYDPATGTWTATGKMIDPRHFHVAILLPDGHVLVAGGTAPGDNPTAKAELYDPNTGAWTAIADMHAPREDIEAFLQPDGKVLVMGGSNRHNTFSVELYDPATGTWTENGDMPSMWSATLLADGTVFLAHDSVAERYDPGTGTWTPTAAMSGPHDPPLGPFILLLDGTVLVSGGSDCLDGMCVVTGAAELYVPAGVSPPPLPAFPSPPPPVIPTPTPIPTPYPPEAGPVPPDARPLKLTVVNRSDQPATLFVADEDERGTMARLAGNVTPHVVPPGARVQVTLLVPAEGVDGWSIWVNPGPDLGGLVGWPDLSTGGEIHILESGQPAWLPEDQIPRP